MEPTTHQESGHGSLRSYTIGFVLSVALTLAAYFAVTQNVFAGAVLTLAIVTLAVIQLLVQLLFFLHLGREAQPRWNLVAFLFALMVVGILVAGTLWIMNNLNYQMSSQQMSTFIVHDEGLKP